MRMAQPDITRLEADYAYKALKEGEIGVNSPYVKEFEEKLADYLGFKYALFTSSGWGALLLACRASGYKEITIPTFTMIASGTSAKQAGMKINFTDVNKRGLMEGQYEGAIMTVDVYGKMCEARSQFVIEDAAEIFGKYDYYGDIVCFSFFYNKIISTGNGGACLTNSKSLYEEMKLLRHHYYDGKSYVHEKDGYNVSQSGVLAAIGTKQLERADEILEKRRALGERYVKELGAWECSEYWYQPLISKDRDGLATYLESKGIPTRNFFTPLHSMPPFGQDIDCPIAEDLSKKGILLPLHPKMTSKDQDYIIKSVKDYEK